MMDNSRLDKTIDEFLSRFNQMCATERRDFLVRERKVNYEHGSRIKTYHVTHQVRKRGNEWLIEAVSSGFWIFKRRFPLLRITKRHNLINFAGIFTSSIRDFKEEQLEEKLNEYLEICKNQPHDVFIKS